MARDILGREEVVAHPPEWVGETLERILETLERIDSNLDRLAVVSETWLGWQ